MHFPSSVSGRSRVARGLAVLFALAATACFRLSTASEDGVPEGAPTVLFIGNSLTYGNNLPGMVGGIAAQGGVTLYVASVALPNYSLEDHWNDGTAQRELAKARYQHVVLQQGPSTLPENRTLLATFTKRYDSLARTQGATSVLYQVWPQANRPTDFPAALESYRNAASAVQGILAPVGDAWNRALAQRPSAGLYDSDGLHATQRGTYLAALVITSRILNFDPTTLPPGLPGVPIDTATARFLQRVALEALQASPARP